ncbi:hypothetical protein ABPG72_018357 [Tetrahymena utriculariae]
MKILIVNGYPDTKEGLQSFLGFRYLVQKIFMEQAIIVDMDTEFVIRKINELDNILYESTSTSIKTSSGRNFDNFDMIFMNGDPYLRPCSKKCQNAQILVRLCLRTHKFFICLMETLVFQSAANFECSVNIIDGDEGGCLTYMPQSSSQFQDLSKWPTKINTGFHNTLAAQTYSAIGKFLVKAVSSEDKMRDIRLRDEAKNQSSLKFDKIVCERTSSLKKKFMSIHQESGSKVLKEFREKINQQENQKIRGNSRQPKKDEQSDSLRLISCSRHAQYLFETTKSIPDSLKSKERKPAIRVKQDDLFKGHFHKQIKEEKSILGNQIRSSSVLSRKGSQQSLSSNISKTPSILNNDPQKSQEELQREQYRKESQKNLGPKSIILQIQKSKVHSNIDPNFIPNYINQTLSKTTAKNHQYKDTLKKNSVGNQDFLLIEREQQKLNQKQQEQSDSIILDETNGVRQKLILYHDNLKGVPQANPNQDVENPDDFQYIEMPDINELIKEDQKLQQKENVIQGQQPQQFLVQNEEKYNNENNNNNNNNNHVSDGDDANTQNQH